MATEPAWTPSERYPDAAVQILDKRLLKCRLPLADVERRATGTRWRKVETLDGEALPNVMRKVIAHALD